LRSNCGAGSSAPAIIVAMQSMNPTRATSTDSAASLSNQTSATKRRGLQ
jgi:hypothetical protein